MDDEKDHQAKHFYTEDNPQPPPSPLLAEYMAKENIDKKMSIEDAKEWFYKLRDSLRQYDKREERRYGRR